MTNTVKSLEEKIKLQVRHLAFFSHDTKKWEPIIYIYNKGPFTLHLICSTERMKLAPVPILSVLGPCK